MTERFRFEAKPHGAGGFGIVVKGRDDVLERDIAVKVLNPLATAFSETEQQRFRREARVLAALSHPNIPAIYDVMFGKDQFLIVFEFIEGRTLKERLESGGPCQLADVKAWFTQIASALEHAHQRTVVHRDVKPANIIIRTTSPRTSSTLASGYPKRKPNVSPTQTTSWDPRLHGARASGRRRP